MFRHFPVWDGVRAELDRSDVTALALPGLRADLRGVGAMKEEYVDWIIAAWMRAASPYTSWGTTGSHPYRSGRVVAAPSAAFLG